MKVHIRRASNTDPYTEREMTCKQIIELGLEEGIIIWPSEDNEVRIVCLAIRETRNRPR